MSAKSRCLSKISQTKEEAIDGQDSNLHYDIEGTKRNNADSAIVFKEENDSENDMIFSESELAEVGVIEANDEN